MQTEHASTTSKHAPDVWTILYVHLYGGMGLLGIGAGFAFGWAYSLLLIGGLLLALGGFSLLYQMGIIGGRVE